MTSRKYPPARNRRDIGEVVFPIEKLLRARELSSSCVGVEALLENDAGPYIGRGSDLDRPSDPEKPD